MESLSNSFKQKLKAWSVFESYLNSFAFNFPTPALFKPFCAQITILAPASEVAGGHAIPF
jgi:hypothetical protein